MNKSKRLIELMLTVNRLRKFTIRELAEQFGVSKRTIHRDLQELSELGVPLYSEVGPHGGYQVLRERVLPPIAFSEEEAVSIFFASHALRHYTDLPFKAETASVLTKFYAFLPSDVKDRIDSMKNRVDFAIPPRQLDSPYLHVLLEASIARKPLMITYDSRRMLTERNILPVGIYATNGFWYCPAYCYLRQAYRRFRVDFIRSVAPCETTPAESIADSVDIHLHNWESRDQQPPQASIPIHVELSRVGVRRCQSELWPSPTLTIDADGTGTLTGDIPACELSYFADFFIGLGQAALVREPETLVNLIRERLSALQAFYTSDSRT